MYVKHGNKKIWHEIITFVCDLEIYIKMSKLFNNVSIFLGLILVMFQFWCNF
jgi:hypothetical protein